MHLLSFGVHKQAFSVFHVMGNIQIQDRAIRYVRRIGRVGRRY
jgi:hypothetical protein